MADLSDLDVDLDKACAAFWLLDQLRVGELSFVAFQDARAAPVSSAWISEPTVATLTQGEMFAAAEDLLLKVIAEALGAAHGTVREMLKGKGRRAEGGGVRGEGGGGP